MANKSAVLIPYDGDFSTLTAEFAKEPGNSFVLLLNGESLEVLEYSLKPSVLVMLQRWIDSWLDSGLRANGTEIPASRTMDLVSSTAEPEGIVAALFDFSKRYMGVLPGPDGLPKLSMADSKQIFQQMTSDSDEAKYHLATFMLTPLREYVAKCRRQGCGRYFTLKQTNREYVGGTICRACAALREKKQSALSMSTHRAEAEAKLYTLLARSFKSRLQQTNWTTDLALRKRMVEFLNREICRDDALRPLYRRSTRIGITPSWFSRAENKLGIASAVAELARNSSPRTHLS